MADEVEIARRDAPTQYFTVADGTAITKGTVMVLSGAMTAIAHSAANEVFLGIATEDKPASDGRTVIGVMRKGIFRMKVTAAVGLGNTVNLGATANQVTQTATTSQQNLSRIVGYALRAATTAEDVIEIYVA